MKTGSKSIEATLSKRRILSAGFVAHMEDTRLPKCAVFEELVGGAVPAESKKRGGWGVSWESFGIPADQCMITAQDVDGWCKTVEQGADFFMAN